MICKWFLLQIQWLRQSRDSTYYIQRILPPFQPNIRWWSDSGSRPVQWGGTSRWTKQWFRPMHNLLKWTMLQRWWLLHHPFDWLNPKNTFNLANLRWQRWSISFFTWDPALKAINPKMRMKPPSDTWGMEWPEMKVLFLSLNRSIRGPNTIAPKKTIEGISSDLVRFHH